MDSSSNKTNPPPPSTSSYPTSTSTASIAAKLSADPYASPSPSPPFSLSPPIPYLAASSAPYSISLAVSASKYFITSYPLTPCYFSLYLRCEAHPIFLRPCLCTAEDSHRFSLPGTQPHSRRVCSGPGRVYYRFPLVSPVAFIH